MSKNKYMKEIPVNKIDVYRVLDAFEVVHPALQHAAKKILFAGKRGGKDYVTDLLEAKQSIERALEMEGEDRFYEQKESASKGK